MLYQEFREYYPYCVRVYFESMSILVVNRDYKTIAEYYAIDGIDYEKELKTFCSKHVDCFRKYENYLECFLYDDNESPFFNGEIIKKLMNEYLKRKKKLDRFLFNLKAKSLSFMH